jgi:hypothetical protein
VKNGNADDADLADERGFLKIRDWNMNTIFNVVPNDDWTLSLEFETGEKKIFDVKPLLECEAFEELRDLKQFRRVKKGGYFVEWENEADLSADTLYLEAKELEMIGERVRQREEDSA